MRWLAKRPLGAQLVWIVLPSAVMFTAVTAVFAISVTRSRNAELLAHHTAPGYHEAARGALTAGHGNAARTQGAASLVLLVGMWLFVRGSMGGVRRRLEALRQAARHLARGELEHPIPTEGDKDELGVLAAALEQMRRDLLRNMALVTEKAALEHELEITGQLAKDFMPRRDDAGTERLWLDAQYAPANRCGGDWWWYEPCADGSLLVLVGDVTGHGAGPALVTASMSTAFRCALREGMTDDVPKLLEFLSDTLRACVGDRFSMTLSVLRVDPTAGRVDWWSAGAPPVMLTRADRQTQTLTAQGTPLGATPHQWGHARARFAPGDQLVVFTDGLPETERPNGRQLGLRRLRKLVETLRARGEETQLAGALIQALRQERGAREQDDDQTVVVVGYRRDRIMAA